MKYKILLEARALYKQFLRLQFQSKMSCSDDETEREEKVQAERPSGRVRDSETLSQLLYRAGGLFEATDWRGRQLHYY